MASSKPLLLPSEMTAQNTPEAKDSEMVYKLPPEVEVIRNMREELVKRIDPVPMILCLGNCLTIMEEQEIRAMETNKGQMHAAMLFLNKLVKKRNFWDDFIKALKHKELVGLEDLAEDLQKALSENKEKEEKSSKTQDTKGVLKLESSHNNTDLQSETHTSKLIQLTEKNPYGYQKSLALPAIEGHNVIMCAPTGSGKTMAASLVCEAHLAKSIPFHPEETADSNVSVEASVQNPKILFLVPRTLILEHVYEELTGYLPLWKVGSRRGNSPTKIPLHQMLKDNDVVVATADIFKNALLLEETMKITDPTLIIFDECHHTTLDHSYNKIMYEYIKAKHQCRESTTEARLPQIVGLTASPGAGKSPSEQSAFLWILQLCANLDAKLLQTVPEEHMDEMRQLCVSVPQKSAHNTDARTEDPFMDKVTKAMGQIEDLMSVKQSSEKPGSPEYESLITTIREGAIKVLDDKTRLCSDHLLCYNKALIMSNTARYIDAFEILQAYYQPIKEKETITSDEEFLLSLFTDMEEDLRELTQLEEQYPNPKLMVLSEMLLSHKEECDKKETEFRGFVFVKTKAIASALKKWMQDGKLGVLHPEILVGVNKGQTEAEQNAVIDGFNSGKFEIIICTSVAEEGLNVKACNLVVRYDDVKNEISMVQSRGRARAVEGHEVIIGETKTIEKDQYNILMEVIMNAGIKHVQSLSEEIFQREIIFLQTREIEKRQEKEREQNALQSQNEADDIELKCKGPCGKIVCKASDMRVVNKTHYVNPDPLFKEKITLKEHQQENYRKKNVQKVHCKDCDHDWGNTSGHYPTLAIKSFIVVINREGRSIKKWSKLPCKIQPCEEKVQLPW